MKIKNLDVEVRKAVKLNEKIHQLKVLTIKVALLTYSKLIIKIIANIVEENSNMMNDDFSDDEKISQKFQLFFITKNSMNSQIEFVIEQSSNTQSQFSIFTNVNDIDIFDFFFELNLFIRKITNFKSS